MFTKRAIVVSTAAGSGTKTAIKDITDTLFYWGVPYILSYGISVQAMGWNGVAEQKKQKIDKDTTKIAAKILKKKHVKAGIKTKALFMMMRMMQKMGWGSGDAEKAYWEQNGWIGKERPWK